MERLNNEFNEQAEVLVAVLQLCLKSWKDSVNVGATAEIKSVTGVVNPNSAAAADNDKKASSKSNVVDYSNSKTSGLILQLQLAAAELAKSKARDIDEIESLKKTFKSQAEEFIAAFSVSKGG